LYFGNLTAYFAAKAGICTKPSVEILATISINFVPFLAILFFTFEYYRNLAPDRQIKKRCTLRSGVQKGKGDAFAEMLLGFDLGFCATADIMIRREANTRDWYTLADIPLYYFQTIYFQSRFVVYE
jgi:hypothetical protein